LYEKSLLQSLEEVSIIKEPYILEFTGLESVLLNHIEDFLLELGFEARQIC